jgi:hypothetical protein
MDCQWYFETVTDIVFRYCYHEYVFNSLRPESSGEGIC